MSKQTFISRFALIIKRLERGPATFAQLKQFLENESAIQGKNFDLSIRTLQRDILHIYEQFNREIVNERKGDKRYFLKDQPENQEHSQRLLDAYDMVNVINASQQHSKYVYFETRKPKGLEHFSGLLYACSHKKILSFNYGKFGEVAKTHRTVHPLALKEARGRWYLVAIDTKDQSLKTFGLDRVQDLDISKTSYKEKYNINISEQFKHSFGIINDASQKPQKIQLQLSHEQGQYLLNYPLHHSQTAIKDEGDEIILELHLKISHDFVMELMSYGDDIMVLSPRSLVNMLVKRGERMIGQYG